MPQVYVRQFSGDTLQAHYGYYNGWGLTAKFPSATVCERTKRIMENSNIAWTHNTQNFWLGCDKIAPE
jgi:hypothetical protein